MNGVALHLRVIALLRDVPLRRRGNLVLQGLAWHDGQRLELRSEGDDKCLCVIPNDLVDQAMPVTGVFRDWYPQADFYIIVGDRLPIAP
jgi:hypothetical protein